MPKDKTAPGSSSEQHGEAPVFFYSMRAGRHGIFTQWHKSPFTVSRSSLAYLDPSLADGSDESVASLIFNCAEQYMMYCKALLFSDEDTAARIMRADTPREQKKLGREVAGFDDKRWAQVREKIVEEANWAKFSAEGNEKLREILLDTRDAKLFEASPKDRIWGIGFREKDAKLMYERGNTKSWGLNLLGKALMTVRQRLREA